MFILLLFFGFFGEISGEGHHSFPGFDEYKVQDAVTYNGPKYQMSFGTVRGSAPSQHNLQIPVDGGHLQVPRAFYHYSETDVGTDAKFRIPEEGSLWDTNAMIKNNRKDIHGVYLPLPNIEPINLHFITQRTYEKGIASQANEDTPEFALIKAKQICVQDTEVACEKALLKYHRLKAAQIAKEREPIVDQLIDLADVASSARFIDKEGQSTGMVVGVPGYDPIYVGAGLNNNRKNRLSFRFSPP
ncbi:hypothetical protein WR25_18055 [Diploscapter pachys]|uniref:Uncharacterized protein n=1 Tax=Diploscapter pachys TaxID=2018661 RepID=A0A2A2JEK3_9BILA|nr:hypothetical protein WR25_18055 [Diploscapter pachys]